MVGLKIPDFFEKKSGILGNCPPLVPAFPSPLSPSFL
jgi:hypothetical protein